MASVETVRSTRPTFILTAAPHRTFFFGGAVQLVAVLVFWLYVLAGWYLAVWTPAQLTVVAPAVHVFLMLYGVFTFFVFGFLTTVFPRWLGTPPIERRRYTAIAALMGLGILGFYAGLFTTRALVLAALVLFLLGWATGLFTLIQVWRRSDAPSRRFALFPFTCVSAGWIGTCLYTAWLFTQHAGLLEAASTIGLWLYLVPLIVAVSYRMIPFFSNGVLDDYTVVKPGWTLPATLVCVLGHFLLTISGWEQWTIVTDLPFALLAAWHSYRWGLLRSLRVPLLGMLHVSFAWLTIALALYAAQSLLRLTGASTDLGVAPLHALGIGLVTGMVVAMASRVSLGHSGRPLVADRVTLWAFAVVQAVAVLRVLAEIPPFSDGRMRLWLVLAAGVVWLIAFVPWSVRFGTVYVRPRVDGRPG